MSYAVNLVSQFMHARWTTHLSIVQDMFQISGGHS